LAWVALVQWAGWIAASRQRRCGGHGRGAATTQISTESQSRVSARRADSLRRRRASDRHTSAARPSTRGHRAASAAPGPGDGLGGQSFGAPCGALCKSIAYAPRPQHGGQPLGLGRRVRAGRMPASRMRFCPHEPLRMVAGSTAKAVAIAAEHRLHQRRANVRRDGGMCRPASSTPSESPACHQPVLKRSRFLRVVIRYG
jgi:hypothetical protein